MILSDKNLEYFTEGTLMKPVEMLAAAKELQIRRQLQEYVRHDDGCDLIRNIQRKPECTCGLSDLQAKLKEVEGV